jgi:DNA-binding CsgD family transcriptional regulator
MTVAMSSTGQNALDEVAAAAPSSVRRLAGSSAARARKDARGQPLVRTLRRHGDGLRAKTVHTGQHEMLIAAWGDFQRWNVKCEVVSHLASARAANERGCALDDVLRDAYAHWLRGGREPLVLGAAALGALRKPCTCALHTALRGMRSVLVHGVRHKLSGCDSLYIALAAQSLFALGGDIRFVSLAHLLLWQLEFAWRRLAAFRLQDLSAAEAIDLSAREREILASLSRGSTNHEIAEGLAISLFTVKNHVKRIFKKIGVSNRTQAAARFNQALMQSAAIESANNAGQ